MTKARAVFGLGTTVALAALIVVSAAGTAALTRVDYAIPTTAELLAACERWVLPHGGFASIMVLAAGSLGVAVVTRTTRSAWRRLRDARCFERGLDVIATAPERPDVRLVEDSVPQAFCAGLRRPRVYLSTGALDLLSSEELRAVLAHEDHHARRRDPLRQLVIRALADGLFFVPAVRRLGDRYAALAELAADEAAERTPAGKRSLASALLAFDASPHSSVVGIAPERADRLLGYKSRWELPALLLAAAAATILTFGALTVRLLQATDHASVSLPVLAAQACMVAMATVPLVLGGSTLLFGRRLLR